ncbi:hypothetical protein [Alkaliphilus serpentinus]|uniref:Flagellar protein FliO/FliZ n=1 Tax=Alkaliphilus serpentinus TaxID=1482731 RepID=A0A833HPX0_9FIRM|nr:hypothetical protein [Alkaliphilus serpentinus]KAB3531372.1 hypothetical protein F8153_04115 [Alkaliphilus serpentinus]
MLKQMVTMLSLLAVMAVVIFLAYITTIYVAKRTGGYFKNPSGRIIERFTLGYQLSITIVEIYNKVYILAIFNKNLQVIDIIPKEDWQKSKDEILMNQLEKINDQSPFSHLKGRFQGSFINTLLNKTKYSSKNEGDKND